jgi:hypothetical protein
MSAAVVADRNAIHMAPLVRYPYKIFYRVAHDIEILHIQPCGATAVERGAINPAEGLPRINRQDSLGRRKLGKAPAFSGLGSGGIEP